MAYEKNKHLANIKKWKLDLSEYKDGVYDGDIEAPTDIKEFNGFEELFGFKIKEVNGYLTFYECKSLTSVSNLPDYVGGHLSFSGCTSLTSVSNLPEYVGGSLSFFLCKSLNSISNLPERVGGYLSFLYCISLTSVSKIPSVVKENIYTNTRECPFFEGMDEEQIREKYGILKE